MKNKDRKIIIHFAETSKPLDMSIIAQAIANAIRKEGQSDERRKEIS